MNSENLNTISSNTHRILGIDPGTYKMGIGIIQKEGTNITFDHSEVIEVGKLVLPKRLKLIFDRLIVVIKDFNPKEIAIEQPYVSKNVKAAMAIGNSQAVAMLAAAQFGIPVSTYPPMTVKQSVTDYGASSKEQVKSMVEIILNIGNDLLSYDSSDALAVAICHANQMDVVAFLKDN
ncbi:MAG: crossover junction endodeoxyribonuclease RuvC [SAR202 cluster bacterium]|nr:crossover junction endodeoxyribonuclease RuvC [SAR202 cluster bacterium]|tara:strand:+ start:129 stop:659 length:531 start_codon:yes stop_codon:yes gene_type:complete